MFFRDQKTKILHQDDPSSIQLRSYEIEGKTVTAGKGMMLSCSLGMQTNIPATRGRPQGKKRDKSGKFHQKNCVDISAIQVEDKVHPVINEVAAPVTAAFYKVIDRRPRDSSFLHKDSATFFSASFFETA